MPSFAFPGLKVISQESTSMLLQYFSHCVEKQFYVADAPNNPATSYHPVAISRITTNAAFYWSHLLIAGDTSKSTAYYATHSATASNFTITAAGTQYIVTLYRSSNVINGLSMYDSSKKQYTGYSVTALGQSSIVLLPGNKL